MIQRIPSRILLISFILVLTMPFAVAQKKEKSADNYPLKSSQLSGLKFRSVGPALTSGRVADIAVNPNNPNEYFVAAASGGVWKTTTAGTVFTPVFDGQGSYSIGCVTYDPTNHHVIWVGTGENNNQRSVAYGDGVYKSEDGGKSWKNMGLKNSEHIGEIVVHPTNGDIVYVSAMGPLWNEGGDRGIYKTTDGGKTWNRVLEIDEHTGVADLVMDPRNPNVLYAASQQRRRHVFTYIGGGPGSTIYKSTDGGATWNKINKGLPGVDMGRIGLAIAPSNPDIVYAIVEAADGKGGFYRSVNRGASWNKMSGYSTSGNYYQEIVCDPKDENKVFVMDTWLHHTEDGGKTVKATGEDAKHVDNHAMWIDPSNTNHWLVGCDGGVYETFDHAKHWDYKSNLPITQFYKVSVDNDVPFYNIYGGTQDNNSQGGPSRTINEHGITNSDWYITRGGDGFETVIDPVNPDIVYSQSQYGWLVRYDRKSGETVNIKPQHKMGDPGLRWNWDAPLIISPHDHERLYFAANKIFKSDDRGDSWTEISPDLTKQIDRNKLKVMGRVWEMEAVEKNKSTTIYGNIIALDESPIQRGLLYAGTDDGLIQVTENDGQSWRKVDGISGIPENTYVNALVCSQHNANRVFTVFNNHKQGDFKPYIMRSNDRGKTWKNISETLPERGTVYDIAEDHINPDLLFAGTEFGVYVSIDRGEHWLQMKSGLPTIAVRDLEIQKRENDLILGTFGRSFYVLDDYSPLREYDLSDTLANGKIYPIKTAYMYFEATPMGNATMGHNLFSTPNPEVGAVFTYLVNDSMKTLKEIRQAAEKKIKKDGGDTYYPDLDAIHAEDRDEKPYLLFEIRDTANQVITRLKKDYAPGLQRVVWDFHYPSNSPIQIHIPKPGRYSSPDKGPMALPGNYTVQLFKVHNGDVKQLTEKETFTITPLNNLTIPANKRDEVLDFQNEVGNLIRTVSTAGKLKSDLDTRLKHIETAAERFPSIPLSFFKEIRDLELLMDEIEIEFNGDQSLASREFETPNSLYTRLYLAHYGSLFNSTNITQTSRDMYKEAQVQYAALKPKLKSAEAKVIVLEKKLDELGIPYTPGRELPDQYRD
ncbi:MAG: glycosyl hydrolase [Bacteroidetes bacterium]|nr:glycosyl hydrolase [Bacteroidota bacterium]